MKQITGNEPAHEMTILLCITVEIAKGMFGNAHVDICWPDIPKDALDYAKKIIEVYNEDTKES